jgi:hypothetical protein
MNTKIINQFIHDYDLLKKDEEELANQFIVEFYSHMEENHPDVNIDKHMSADTTIDFEYYTVGSQELIELNSKFVEAKNKRKKFIYGLFKNDGKKSYRLKIFSQGIATTYSFPTLERAVAYVQIVYNVYPDWQYIDGYYVAKEGETIYRIKAVLL